jgi:hypothetical protein
MCLGNWQEPSQSLIGADQSSAQACRAPGSRRVIALKHPGRYAIPVVDEFPMRGLSQPAYSGHCRQHLSGFGFGWLMAYSSC